jgi:transposase
MATTAKFMGSMRKIVEYPCTEYVEDMDDKQLYTQLLGVTQPWRVDRVELSVENQEVLVYVECRSSSAVFACPECHRESPCHDDREERRWRHLDSCGFTTYLVARVPRVRCEQHGVKTIAVPWSQPHSRFTQAFECLALTVLQSTMVQSKAAALLRLSPAQIHDLMERAVRRGLSRRHARSHTGSEPTIEHVSIDEKSFKRGHSFVSVLGDTRRACVLEVVEGHCAKDAKRLLEQGLTPTQRQKVKSVTMDMWPPFQQAQEAVLAEADIVHDRFHIAKYLGDAVDFTRRQEHSQLAAGRSKNSPLHRTKYYWLSDPKNLTAEKRAVLNAVREQNLETAKVWMFKESFREFYTARDINEAIAFFFHWKEMALELNNKFLTKVVNLMQNHQRGVLNYHFHHTSNATAEALNGQIQRIKANARGFRKFENFRTAILFFLGKLDIFPQTSS